MQGVILLALVLVMLGLAPLGHAQERRVALVIGNGQYRYIGNLPNPPNDARAMAAALGDAGFSLIGGGPQIDLDKPGMERALRSFGRALGPDAVGLFFFAGHGIAVREVNYLVPVEANPQRESDADFDLVDSRIVLRQMADAGNRLNMLILDACRNNPLAGRGFRSSGAGLARMEAPAGTLIHYATAPGKVAADGAGANSPYTSALVETLREPGLGVMDVFNQVGLKVMQRTGHAQEPWLALSPIQGQFQFVPAAAAPSPPQVAPPPLKPEIAIDPIDRDYVAKATARLRAAPDVMAKQVATLKEGEEVLVLGKVKGQAWYQVERKGEAPAYVSAGLLEEAAAHRKQAEDGQRPPQQVMVAPTPAPGGAAPAPGRGFRDCADCPEMVPIPAGSFEMGSDNGDSDEKPVHRVSIPRDFAIGKFEVTFAEWDACVAAGGCSHRADDHDWGRGNRPVMNVSWDDAQNYVRWLSRKTGKTYRLPSEAEWEYAAKEGGSSDIGGDALKGRNQANCNGCGSQWDSHQTAPVGSFAPNRFGVNDMLGNVWEWVEDCFSGSYAGAPGDGTAWSSGDCSKRILRGGSWFDIHANVRAAFRDWYPAALRNLYFGFRLARSN